MVIFFVLFFNVNTIALDSGQEEAGDNGRIFLCVCVFFLMRSNIL